MATYKLKYTGAEIDSKLDAVDKLTNITTDGTKTSFGGNVEVDGNLKVNGEIITEETPVDLTSLLSIETFTDENGNYLVSPYSVEQIRDILIKNHKRMLVASTPVEWLQGGFITTPYINGKVFRLTSINGIVNLYTDDITPYLSSLCYAMGEIHLLMIHPYFNSGINKTIIVLEDYYSSAN